MSVIVSGNMHFEVQAGYCSCNYIYFPVAFLAIV